MAMKQKVSAGNNQQLAMMPVAPRLCTAAVLHRNSLECGVQGPTSVGACRGLRSWGEEEGYKVIGFINRKFCCFTLGFGYL